MYANRRNFRVFEEIWVDQHDSDVRFWTGSRNIAVSCMRNENMQYNPYLMVWYGMVW